MQHANGFSNILILALVHTNGMGATHYLGNLIGHIERVTQSLEGKRRC